MGERDSTSDRDSSESESQFMVSAAACTRGEGQGVEGGEQRACCNWQSPDKSFSSSELESERLRSRSVSLCSVSGKQSAVSELASSPSPSSAGGKSLGREEVRGGCSEERVKEVGREKKLLKE